MSGEKQPTIGDDPCERRIGRTADLSRMGGRGAAGISVPTQSVGTRAQRAMLIISPNSPTLEKIRLPVRRSPLYFAVAAAVLLWCAALVAIPLARAAGFSPAADGYAFFSHICHQEDARSLHIAGYPIAVCARCSAIYFAFFAGVLLSPFLSRRMRMRAAWFWLAAIIPMLLDVGADLLGIHASNLFTRLGSGGWFGVIAATILTPILVSTCSVFFQHSRKLSRTDP